jgi:transposase
MLWSMRPYGSPQQLEKRRRYALLLLKAGKSLAAVARAVCASVSSVWEWRQAYRKHGSKGLCAKPILGRPPELSPAQKEKLVQLLLRGPKAAGFDTELWTLNRVAKVIRRKFKVRYHPGHVWKLLTQLGWSCQKPERRAVQRDEAAIAHWKRYVWPQIKKKAKRLGAHLVFLDESGFLLIPNVKRTWAPRGRTPVVHYRLSHQKLSAISALSVSPKRKHIALYLQFRPRAFKAPDVQAFLAELLRQVRGPVILLWDRGPIHTDGGVQAFIEKHPRLQCEYFPGYAPELNPAEFVWSQADAALANSAPEDLKELRTRLNKSKRRLHNSQQLLWSCIWASDLPWTH